MDKTAIRKRFDYIPAGREAAWGLHVIGAGQRIEPPHEKYQRPEPVAYGQWEKGRKLRDYGLVYLTDGQGAFAAEDAGWRNVRAGDVLMLFPGIWHNYHPHSETGWTERWVLFNGDFANQWCAHELITPAESVLHIGVRSELVERFERLLEIAGEHPPYANQIQAGVTMEILGLILKFHQDRSPRFAKRARLIKRALEFIAKNWNREINFDRLAAEMGSSLRQFRRLFQQVTGLSPQQYLIHLRLNEAKRLLGTLSVAEVAARVGFEDPFYFSRLFKEKVGVSPKHWH